MRNGKVMGGLALTRHCLINGHIIYTLEQEYEQFRTCVLDKHQNNEDYSVAMAWFTKTGKKLAKARRLALKLRKAAFRTTI